MKARWRSFWQLRALATSRGRELQLRTAASPCTSRRPSRAPRRSRPRCTGPGRSRRAARRGSRRWRRAPRGGRARARAAAASRRSRTSRTRSTWSVSTPPEISRISIGCSPASTKSVTPTLTRSPRSNRSCSRNADSAIACWKTPRSMPGEDPFEHRALAHREDARELGLGELLHPVGERLEEVRATQGVDHVGDARLVRDDLLGPERELGGLLGRQRQDLVERVRVQRLGAAQDGGQRLDRRPHDVVHRLLRGERDPRRLRVEPQPHRGLVLRAVALLAATAPRSGARRGTSRSPRRSRRAR